MIGTYLSGEGEKDLLPINRWWWFLMTLILWLARLSLPVSIVHDKEEERCICLCFIIKYSRKNFFFYKNILLGFLHLMYGRSPTDCYLLVLCTRLSSCVSLQQHLASNLLWIEALKTVQLSCPARYPLPPCDGDRQFGNLVQLKPSSSP